MNDRGYKVAAFDQYAKKEKFRPWPFSIQSDFFS